MAAGTWWLKVRTVDGIDHVVGPVDTIDVKDWVLHAARSDMSVGFPLHGIWSWHVQPMPFTGPEKVTADG